MYFHLPKTKIIMKTITQLIFLFSVALVSAQIKSTNTPITLSLGEEIKMHSTVLKEERSLLIHTPRDYDTTDKKYSVIYVLDGNNHFSHTVNAVNTLTEFGRMPASIVVAIPNNRGTRGRDLANQRDNFKKYIKEEVIPFVTKNYRTNKTKTLFGHSLAGAFTLNYLVTEPQLFDNYIAASPVVQIFNSELHNKFSTFFKTLPNIDKSVYFTLTEANAESTIVYNAMNKFVDLFKKEAPKSLRWKYNFIENHVHMTTPYITIYNGLNQVFSDFQAPTFHSYQDYAKKGSLEGLKQYFARRAKKYNVSSVITDETLRMLADVLYRDQKEKLAEELLILNTKNHPNSIGALNSLARLYRRLDKIDTAKETYKKIIELAEKQKSPNSAYFKRQLERL